MKDHRKSVRLKVNKGAAVLNVAGISSIACELHDLSKTGCLCSLLLPTLDPEIAKHWPELLKPGTLLEVTVSQPPDIFNLLLSAQTTHLEHTQYGTIEVGLQFNIGKEQLELMGKALLNVATKILHDKCTFRLQEPSSVVSPHKSEGLIRFEVNLARPLLRATHLIEAVNEVNETIAESNQLAHCLNSHLFTETQLGLPAVDLNLMQLPSNVTGIFSFLTLQRHRFVPFACSEKVMCVAVIEPLSKTVVYELEKQANRHLLEFVAPAGQIHLLQYKNRTSQRNKERSSTRIKVNLRTSYQFWDGNGELLSRNVRQGMMLNLSECGGLMAVPVERNFSQEDLESKHKLQVCIDPKGRSVRLNARIVFVNTVTQDENRWLLGMEWIGFAGIEAKKLSEVYRSCAMEQLKNRSRGFALD